MVGGTDDAFLFHALDDAGGAVVADLQVALDETSRGLALAGDERDRLIVELVAGAAIVVIAAKAEAAAFGGVLGDILDIVGLGPGLERRDDALDLFVGDKGAMDASNAAAAGHVEHVATAEELLGAALAENGAAVDL